MLPRPESEDSQSTPDHLLNGMVNGRIYYLLQLSTNIKRVIQGTMSANDRKEFLLDVFGMELDNFKIAILEDLIQEQICILIMVKKFLQEEFSELSACRTYIHTLNVKLKCDSAKSFLLKNKVGRAPGSLAISENFFLISQNIITEFHQQFARMFPEMHSAISTVLQGKNLNKPTVHLKWRWDKLSDKLDKDYRLLSDSVEKIKKLEHLDLSSSINFLKEIKAKHSLISTLHTSQTTDFSKEGLNFRSDMKESDIACFVDVYLLQTKANHYLARLNQVDKKIQDEQDSYTHYKTLQLLAKDQINFITLEWQRNKDRLTTFKGIERNANCDALSASLDNLKTRIENLSQEWPEVMPQYLTSSEALEKHQENFIELYTAILTRMGFLQNKLLLKFTTIKERNNAIKQAEEEKQQHLLTQLQADTESFKAEKARQLEEYKEKVNKAREDKKTLIAPIEKIFAVNSFSTTFKNTSMEDILNELSERHLSLIQDILKGTAKVRFEEVCTLIKNQLKGKVLEIGNGTSHRRIILERYTMDIISHGSSCELPSKSSKITGGFFNPHGKTHTEKLSAFNVSLVADTFQKAGITLEVIERLLRAKTLKESCINDSPRLLG